jgi:hypothetical protein
VVNPVLRRCQLPDTNSGRRSLKEPKQIEPPRHQDAKKWEGFLGVMATWRFKSLSLSFAES